MILTNDLVLPYGKYKEGFEIPNNLIVRGANAFEWKSIVSATSENYRYRTIGRMLDQTVGYNDNWDVRLLSPIDLHAIVIEIRKLTFSHNYKFEVRCGMCGDVKLVDYDLREIEYIKNNVDTTLELDAEIDGKKVVVGIDLPNEKRINDSRKRCMELYNKKKKNDRMFDMGFDEFFEEYRVIDSVSSLNGNACNYDYFMLKVGHSLSMLDYMKIEDKLREVFESCRMEGFKFVCGNCGEEEVVEIPFTYEFLHPRHK